MQLETERLILREMAEVDYEALYGIWADRENMRHYPYSFDEKRVRQWIARNRERCRVFSFGLWAVARRGTGEVIGDCGLTMQLIGDEIKPEIGYHIRRDCQRKGFGSEAARATREWAFENTPFHILYSYMKYTNVGSCSTALANGMRLVDEFEDAVNTLTRVYAITREEWREITRRG